MNDETRTALIELWRDVPGTKPIQIEVHNDRMRLAVDRCSPSQSEYSWDRVSPFTEPLVEALARDAIVEWLHGQGVGEVQSGKTYDKDESDWYMVWVSGTVRGEGPTRLSALIAAARAVHKGAERGE